MRRKTKGMPAVAGSMSETAAAWLACGIDLPRVLGAPATERAAALCRIRRAMERERWKNRGIYDLDRHLALKRCRDRLSEAS